MSYLTNFGDRLAERDGWICHYCGIELLSLAVIRGMQFFGEPISASNRPYVDHKTPRSHGGTDDLSNLVLACYQCNHIKSDKYDHDQFVALLALGGSKL